MATFRKLDGTPFQQFVPEADCPVHDLGLKSPVSEPKVRYIGWIKAKVEDAERLKELGVCGEMLYCSGVFGHCEVPDEKTMDRLEKEFPGFWRGSFSVISD